MSTDPVGTSVFATLPGSIALPAAHGQLVLTTGRRPDRYTVGVSDWSLIVHGRHVVVDGAIPADGPPTALRVTGAANDDVAPHAQVEDPTVVDALWDLVQNARDQVVFGTVLRTLTVAEAVISGASDDDPLWDTVRELPFVQVLPEPGRVLVRHRPESWVKRSGTLVGALVDQFAANGVPVACHVRDTLLTVPLALPAASR